MLAGACFGVRGMRRGDGGRQGLARRRGRGKLFRVELRFEVGKHVVGGGADAAGAGKGDEVPGVGGLVVGVVTRDEVGTHVGREEDGGMGHAQRACDLLVEELWVGDAGAIGECLAKQADAEIAVEKRRVGGKCNAVLGDEGVEMGSVVVGVGVGRIGGRKVVGHARQAGVLDAEVEERDLGAGGGFGDSAGREKLAHRLVKADFVLLDHLREDRGGEGLGDGSDFEDGVVAGGAVGEDFALAVLEDADGDAGVGAGCERSGGEGGGEILVEDGLKLLQRNGRKGGIGLCRRGGSDGGGLAFQLEREWTGALAPVAVEGVGGERSGEAAADDGNVDGDGVDGGGEGAGNVGRALVEGIEGASPGAGGVLMEAELDAEVGASGMQGAEPCAVEG